MLSDYCQNQTRVTDQKEYCAGQYWDTAAVQMAMPGPICKSWMLGDTGQSEAYL